MHALLMMIEETGCEWCKTCVTEYWDYWTDGAVAALECAGWLTVTVTRLVLRNGDRGLIRLKVVGTGFGWLGGGDRERTRKSESWRRLID